VIDNMIDFEFKE